MPQAFRSILTLAVLVSAPAAQTFLVDAANGPGAHFTTISAAIAAVPEGAVLRILPGLYQESLVIVGKSLTLLGEGGEVRGSTLAISGLQSHQSVLVDGLRLGATQTYTQVQNCRGAVHLNGVYSPHHNLEASSCDQITLRGMDLKDSTFDDCTAVLESVRILGRKAVPGEEALVVTNGSMQLVACRVDGSPGFGFPLAGVRLDNAALRVLGNSTLSGGFGLFQQRASAVIGNGTLRVDPAVMVYGAAPLIAPTVQYSIAAMPNLDRTDGGLGDTITASLRGPVGHLGILLLGHPAAPHTVSWLVDELWYQPAASVVQAIGFPQQGAPLSGSLVLPNDTGFLGYRLVWQAVTYDAAGGYQASNPSQLVVRD